jgi:hypothetical protein
MTKFFAAIGFLAVLAGAVIAALMLWEKYRAYEEDEEIIEEESDETLEKAEEEL